jgi:hypothetical protein
MFSFRYIFGRLTKAQAGKFLTYVQDQRQTYNKVSILGYIQKPLIKQDHIGNNRFENIIVGFIQEFDNLKLLACKLRYTLFPIRDGNIFTGIFHDQWDRPISQ